MTTHTCAACHAGPFAPSDASAHYPPDQAIALVHLDLALRVDIDARTLIGRATHRVRGKAGAKELTLDALDFESVSVEGASSAYDGSKLSLYFERPFLDDEERVFVVSWKVVEPPSGLLFSSPSDEDPEACRFAVTDHETERARHWLPTVDHPSARPTLSFAITTEATATILANGSFLGEAFHEDGTKTARFALEHPCPSYLTCFALGDFVRYEGESVGTIPVAAFAPRPFTEEQLERSFGKTSEMLRFFERKLGVAYPYPKYQQFAATGIGGAMENISLVSWDDRFVLDEALATEEGPLVDVVNVHEMAHAWFGDHVVCRDFAHSWLKESWATYMETVWLGETLGKDYADYDLLCNADAYFGESDDRYRRPIVTRTFESSWDLFDMHLYQGGSLRLHMLRKRLGDEVFWSAVSNYLRAHGRGTVETDDFRKALEARSGRSLVRFFDQWLYGVGFPELEVKATFDAEAKVVRVVVTQKQVEAQPSVPPFAFDLVVEVDDGTSVRRGTLRMERARAEIAIPASADPRSIVLDPDHELLARYDFNPGTPRLLRQLEEGSDVRLRIFAGRALAKSGKDANIRAIGRALEREPFYGVRIAICRALGEAGTAAALDILLSRAAVENEPRVLAALFASLGKYRDARIVTALERRLDEGLPPRASAAAFEALGEQKQIAPFERLLRGASSKGFGGIAASGALRALGKTGSSDVLEALLLSLRPSGAAARARPAAASALGLLAHRLEPPARARAEEALVDALRDKDSRVRRAASNALVEVGSASALARVRAFAKTLTPQDRIRVERSLQGASPTANAALVRAESRLDAVTKQLDELRTRLETIEAGNKPSA